MEFYHLSRAGLIEEQLLDKRTLSNDAIEKRYRMQNEECFHSDEELLAQLGYFNQQGITNHGKQYLVQNSAYVRYPEGLFLDISWVIEMIWELVRKAYFSHLPSRFSSIFAFESIDEVENFMRGRTDLGSSKLYKVKAATHFKGDMNLLKIPNIGIGLEVIAKKYWEGKASCSPQWEYLLSTPVSVIEEIPMDKRAAA